MKKKIFSVFVLFVLLLTFSFNVFANQEVASGRANTYQSLHPLSMELQVNGDGDFHMVSFGDVHSSLPLHYHESGYADDWVNTVSSEKTFLDYPGGTSPVNSYTIFYLSAYSTEIDDLIRDLSSQEFGQTEYSRFLPFLVNYNGVNYSYIECTDRLLWLRSGSGSKLMLYEEPELLPEGNPTYRLRVDLPVSDTRSGLGDFASLFTFNEFSSGGDPIDPTYRTDTYEITYDNHLVRNNEGIGFRATLTSTLSMDENCLYFSNGSYQFRPTFSGGNFAMGFGADLPWLSIGTNTARVDYSIMYVYIVRTLQNNGTYKVEYRTGVYTNSVTNASGAVYIIPAIDDFFEPNINPLLNESVVYNGDQPALYILSYSTVISVRQTQVGQTFSLRRQYSEADQVGFGGSTGLYSWLASFGMPLYSSFWQDPGQGGIGGGSGGVTTDSAWGAFGSFISTSVGAFFDIDIFGDFSLGDIMWFVFGVAALFAVLKYFAGG